MEPKEIGIFDTKTHLSEIIGKVEEGQRFYITKRGKRIAELRPVEVKRKPLRRGCVKNDDYSMGPDFGDTPADFEDYV